MGFHNFHGKVITSFIVLIGVLSFSCFTQVRSAQAFSLIEYTVLVMSDGEAKLGEVLRSTENVNDWNKNGNRVVVQTLAQNSQKTLAELKEEISLNGENASQGRVVSGLAKLISWSQTMVQKTQSESSHITTSEYAVLVAFIAAGVVKAVVSLGSAIEEAFDKLEPLLGETLCADGIDNDSDGAIDCADSECSILSLCTTPSTETNCTDAIDDDNDGDIDCADSDCANDSACMSTKEDCNNGVDDDGDGLIDCCDALDCPTEFCQRICGIDDNPNP